MTTEMVPKENGSAIEQAAPRRTLKDFIESKKSSIAAVAANNLSPERLLKVFGTACSRVPKLMQCEPVSVVRSLMTCAELGLMPGALGEAYLIPFENGRNGTVECQIIIGYRGLLALARRSGAISTISSEVVRVGDDFAFAHGIHTEFRHVPKADTDSPVTHVWALAKFKDGSFQLVVLTKKEVDAIRGRSRAAKSGPWVTDYAEMAKKTALRRLCKLLPLSAEVAEQIEKADRTEFELDDFGAVPEAPEPGVAGLVNRLDGGEQGDAPADTPPEGETPAPSADDPLAGSTPLDRPAPPAPRGRK